MPARGPHPRGLPAGDTATIDVSVNADDEQEPNERLEIQLTAPEGGLLRRERATGVILSDDGGVAAERGYHTVQPCRVLDTRDVGGYLAAGEERTLPIVGRCGIPETAGAVSINIT